MTPTAEQIRDWIVGRVSALAEVPPEEIDVRAPLMRLGLDSVMAIALATDLENWLNYRFRGNPLDAHPTIDALAGFLAAEVARRQS